jgi:FkbM family methyltransferase
MKTIIEIGANRGTDTQRLLAEYPDAIIYAFEPTHELLVHYLWPIAAQNKRLNIVPFAVDNCNIFTTFNIAGQGDWGCSSLYEFADDLSSKWPNRPDFNKSHEYTVPTITMYDFCHLYNIDSIDHLHIDTQGNDFNCLLSFKEKINIVKSGRCEVAGKTELYKNTNNTYKNVYPWLREQNFNVRSGDNPEIAHEVDLFFDKNELC